MRIFSQFVVQMVAVVGALVSTFGGSVAMAQDPEEEKQKQEETRQVLAELPDAEAKKILQLRCAVCHSLRRVASGRKTAESWSNTVQVMVLTGATLETREADILIPYLAANFGLPVNVNKASAEELAKVPSLDAKLASAIVNYREKNGAFAKIEELLKVEGLDEELLRKIKPRLTVGIPERAPPK